MQDHIYYGPSSFEKNTSGSVSAFFAKLMQYQTRLGSTDFKIQDIDLISHVLSYGILPQKFESTVEVLRLQPNTSWSALTQILINNEIQMNTLSEKPTTTTTTTTAMVSSSKFRKNQGQNQGQKLKHLKRKRSSQSRNQENSDNSDSDDNPKASSKSKSKDKDSSMQCYYCCKHSHKATGCKL